ncbi:MAG: YitT family protein [Nanobdellota archaeon]
MPTKKRVKFDIFNLTKEIFFILVGIGLAGFGLKGFLIPAGFIDGGVTGISLLIHFLTPLSISILIFIINLPFIFLAQKQIGKIFAIKTFFAIIVLSLSLLWINYPIITHDKLLVAVFGGFLLGAGIGLSVRGGSVLDGTEILSVYLNRKVGFSIGEIIFFINVIIFSFAAIFLGVEIALYSLLTYLVASKSVDLISHGLEEYTGLTIISDKNKEIRKKLFELGNGVTIYKGNKGYADDKDKKEIDILFTIVTRLEVSKIEAAIKNIDNNALIIEENISDIEGGFIKKRRPKIVE